MFFTKEIVEEPKKEAIDWQYGKIDNENYWQALVLIDGTFVHFKILVSESDAADTSHHLCSELYILYKDDVFQNMYNSEQEAKAIVDNLVKLSEIRALKSRKGV